MLRRTRLYYRAALLLQSANLSLHECCLRGTTTLPPLQCLPLHNLSTRRFSASVRRLFCLLLTKSKLFLVSAPMKISSTIFWVLIYCLPACQKFPITTGLLPPTGICKLCRKHLELPDNIFIVATNKGIIVSNTLHLFNSSYSLRCKTPPFLLLHLIPSLPNF